MIDLARVGSEAIQAGAQVIAPLLMYAGGFVAALYGVLLLIVFFADLFE